MTPPYLFSDLKPLPITSESTFELSRYITESHGRGTLRFLHPTEEIARCIPLVIGVSKRKTPFSSVRVALTNAESSFISFTVANSTGIESADDIIRADKDRV